MLDLLSNLGMRNDSIDGFWGPRGIEALRVPTLVCADEYPNNYWDVALTLYRILGKWLCEY